MKLLEPVYLRGELNRLVVDEVRWTRTHFFFYIQLTILGSLYIRAWKDYWISQRTEFSFIGMGT